MLISGRRIGAKSSAFAAREYERVDSSVAHHTDLKVGVGWRN
jgi:hypothetical protein